MPFGKKNANLPFRGVLLVIFFPPFALSHFHLAFTVLRRPHHVATAPQPTERPRLLSALNGVSYNLEASVGASGNDSVGSNNSINDDRVRLTSANRSLTENKPVQVTKGKTLHNRHQNNPTILTELKLTNLYVYVLNVPLKCWDEGVVLGDIPSHSDYDVSPLPEKLEFIDLNSLGKEEKDAQIKALKAYKDMDNSYR
jgi:hypothetical protein